jgi:putative polymerase
MVFSLHAGSELKGMPARSVSVASASGAHGSTGYVTLLLLVCCGHHWFLCLLQNVGIHTNPSIVGAVELLLYLSCAPLLRYRISPRMITAILFTVGVLTFMAILREGRLDIKAIRDLLIPAIFIWTGRSWSGSLNDLDRSVRVAVIFIVGIALVETIAFDTYTRFINTFTYYVGLGGISESNAQVSGQTVTLNGLRPEGIGRTLLPQILGNHRASSVFLEPVSFGNFAVIVMAWALSKPVELWKRTAWFGGAALVMIVLADSRFALYSATLLVLLRICLKGNGHYFAMLAPLIGLGLLFVVAVYAPGAGDNLHGRLTTSGAHLLEFDEAALFGMSAYNIDFGDMGYAYVISRFGLPLVAALWILLFALPLKTEQARRFRTFTAAYMALILCISGTSVFALKTAAMLWFLFGYLSVQRQEQRPEQGARNLAVAR